MNYFEEYATRHDAIMILWDAYDRAEFEHKGKIRRAINYLRGTAMVLIPYEATTPNRVIDGRRYGRQA